jgi:hypothetical protein
MGYSLAQIEQMEAWDEQDNPMGSLARMYGPPRAVPDAPADPPPDLVGA